MADAKMSGFRDPEGRARYEDRYDRFVADQWPVAHTELDVETRFGPTHVRRSGPADGVPLVLVHPSSGSSLGWYRLVEGLAHDRPVFTPDTIGTAGRSVQTAPITSAADLGAWLDDTLDGLRLDRVHLLGYSEGGWIAATHAATTVRPDRLATLTLIEPGGALASIRRSTLARLILRGVKVVAGIGNRERGIRSLNAWLSPGVEMTDDEIQLVLTTFQTFRQRLPMPATLTDEQLAAIVVPTLVLLARDTVLYDPEAAADRARRTIPDASVDIVPDAGHGLPFQHPDLVIDRVLRFLDQSPATANR